MSDFSNVVYLKTSVYICLFFFNLLRFIIHNFYSFFTHAVDMLLLCITILQACAHHPWTFSYELLVIRSSPSHIISSPCVLLLDQHRMFKFLCLICVNAMKTCLLCATSNILFSCAVMVNFLFLSVAKKKNCPSSCVFFFFPTPHRILSRRKWGA